MGARSGNRTRDVSLRGSRRRTVRVGSSRRPRVARTPRGEGARQRADPSCGTRRPERVLVGPADREVDRLRRQRWPRTAQGASGRRRVHRRHAGARSDLRARRLPPVRARLRVRAAPRRARVDLGVLERRQDTAAVRARTTAHRLRRDHVRRRRNAALLRRAARRSPRRRPPTAARRCEVRARRLARGSGGTRDRSRRRAGRTGPRVHRRALVRVAVRRGDLGAASERRRADARRASGRARWAGSIGSTCSSRPAAAATSSTSTRSTRRRWRPDCSSAASTSRRFGAPSSSRRRRFHQRCWAREAALPDDD